MLDMEDKQTRAASSLATRLRLTPSSQHSNREARRQAAMTRKPWEMD